MKSILKKVLVITPITLIAFVFVFQSDPKWMWVSFLSQAILIAYGLVGGTLGFIEYGIRRKKTPLSEWLKYMVGSSDPPFKLNPFKNERAVVAVAFLVSAVSAALFIINIYTAINDGQEVRTGTQMYIDKPGDYTLLIDGYSGSDVSNKYQIINIETNELMHSYPITGAEVINRNGKRFYGISYFKASSPATYRIDCSDSQHVHAIVIKPSVSVSLIGYLLLLFIISAAAFLTGSCYILGRVFKVISTRQP